MKLPESWVECRLTPVLTCLETGGRPSGGVGEIESGIPSISGEHFNWRGEFNFSSLKYIPDSYYQTLQTGLLRHGGVLIVKDGATTAKCAYIDENFPFPDAAINEHVFLVRTNPNILDSRYLFELLRSEFGKAQILRNYRGAAIGGIPRGFTDHIKLPLPTYPEQQRIINVLRQAEALIALQQTRGGQLDLLIKAYLDSLILNVDESDWTQLGNLVETRYGTSVSADEEAGTGTPVLRIPNVIGGEVDTADMKYVGVSTSELERLFLTKEDVLIVRSNGNPNYVGRSAPITDDIEKAGMIYASYLIRLRADTDSLLPEYLSSFLNSAFGRAAMRNVIRTTAGQSNLSAENLARIRIPLPEISEQKKFTEFWHEVRLLRKVIDQSERLATRLQADLTVSAFSGELTEEWRKAHRQEIVAGTAERDKSLHERGAVVSIRTEVFVKPERPTDFSRPMRQWLIDELSEFQHEVWNMLRHEWRGLVIVDDPEVFDDFCTNPQTAWRIEHFKASNKRIRQTLEQLAALGLIAKVSVPKSNAVTQQTEYLTAFRPLREDENTRLLDAARLKNDLEKNASASSNNADASNGPLGEQVE